MNSLFHPQDWSYNSNIYEVNTRQYTKEGTFTAMEKELPRLRDMGIEILWFMPITPISFQKRLGSLGSYYACSDYTSINPEFGNLEDFRAIIKSAHNLGFKVIIDWVANHTGWDHRWTREHPEFYRKNQDGNFFDPHGWEDVIDLNYDNKALWYSMIESMLFWIDQCDIDGFRCDMAMLVPIEFWIEARKVLDKRKKLFWLAECEDHAYQQAFDAVYTWKFLHKMEAFWKQETGILGLEEVLNYYDNLFDPTTFRSYFTSNHDENSHSGSEYERMGAAARVFAVLCCMWNGIPMIYSGQELPNYKRLQFFNKDQIDWNGHFELHDFYKTLLTIRKNNAAMKANNGQLVNRLSSNADDKIFAFLRKDVSDTNQVLVVLNLSPVNLAYEMADAAIAGFFKDAFLDEIIDFDKYKSIELKAWDYKIFVKG